MKSLSLTFAAVIAVLLSGSGMAQDSNSKTPEISAGQTGGKLSEVSQFVLSYLPIVQQFELARQTGNGDVLSGILTKDHHFARFPGGDERVNFEQLIDELRDCDSSGYLNANSVAITIHYDCAANRRSRLVFNFRDNKIDRVLVGDIPRKLRCLDGLCIDQAEKR